MEQDLAKTEDEEFDAFEGTLSKQRSLWSYEAWHYQNAIAFVVADPQQSAVVGSDPFQKIIRSRNAWHQNEFLSGES
jgi:hypothetical protein